MNPAAVAKVTVLLIKTVNKKIENQKLYFCDEEEKRRETEHKLAYVCSKGNCQVQDNLNKAKTAHVRATHNCTQTCY